MKYRKLIIIMAKSAHIGMTEFETVWVCHGQNVPFVVFRPFLNNGVLAVEELVDDVGGHGRGNPFSGVDTLKVEMQRV
jgi:hypothetical protein